jgi:hypothetical protein
MCVLIAIYRVEDAAVDVWTRRSQRDGARPTMLAKDAGAEANPAACTLPRDDALHEDTMKLTTKCARRRALVQFSGSTSPPM